MTARRIRGIRVEESVWRAAMDKAAQRGEGVPELVRRFLAGYAAGAESTDTPAPAADPKDGA